jgi:hypothetical protein
LWDGVGPTGFELGIDRLKAYQAHEPLHPLAFDLVAQAAQMVSHPAAAAKWPIKILLVDQAHVFQVFVRDRPWLVIDRLAADVNHLALSRQAQFCDPDRSSFFSDRDLITELQYKIISNLAQHIGQVSSLKTIIHLENTFCNNIFNEIKI